MSNSAKPAMPVPGLQDHEDFNGLSKREHFAALAMQGFCAAPEFAETSVEDLAAAAVRQADALLDALESAGGNDE